MRRAVFLIAAILPAAAGCAAAPAVLSGLGAAGSIYSAVGKITEAVDTSIATGCAEYEKNKAAADAVIGTGQVTSAAGAKVASIESFGDAVCGSGSAPPSGDPLATAIWLGQLAGQITTLTSAAQ